MNFTLTDFQVSSIILLIYFLGFFIGYISYREKYNFLNITQNTWVTFNAVLAVAGIIFASIAIYQWGL